MGETPTVHVPANPQGAALLAELDRIHERIVSQDPDGVPDLSALLRHFLADPRAREISCLLAEIEAGFEPLINTSQPTLNQV